MYLGQYEFVPGEHATFEQTIGRKLALGSYLHPMSGLESLAPSFDVSIATAVHGEGDSIFVGAIEPTPSIEGFSVDALLRGDFDDALGRLADQFREFGRPMFFEPGREFNGVLASTWGGFGPDGTKDTGWALEQGKGFAEFDPSQFPNPDLYQGLGDDEVCDGAERVAAAHRYYYDFFVRREGLDFLTFVSSGWAARRVNIPDSELGTQEARLLTSCGTFANSYPGNEYVDWVGLNRHFFAEPNADGQDAMFSTSETLRLVDETLRQMAAAAPDKPVLLMEVSFTDGMNQDSEVAAAKVREALPALLAHEQIRGLYFWGNAGDPSSSSQDFLIRPGTAQGDALRAVLDAYPAGIVSCVEYSDHTSIDNCDPSALSMAP